VKCFTETSDEHRVCSFWEYNTFVDIFEGVSCRGVFKPEWGGIRTVNRKQLFAGQLIADNYSQDICLQRHVFAVTVVRHTINRPDNLRCQSGQYCL